MFSLEEEEWGKNNLPKKGFIGREINVFVENVFVNGVKRAYRYKVKIIKL
jgi:hypothetical protein